MHTYTYCGLDFLMIDNTEYFYSFIVCTSLRTKLFRFRFFTELN